MTLLFFEITIIIAFIYLIIGSYTDIRTLEVPDWISYSLISVGFFFNLILSFYYNNSQFILNSLFGFLISLIFGILLYYSGQWGGGDSKVLFGLGSLFGLNLYSKNFIFSLENLLNDFYLKFLVNILFMGAIYGFIWIIFMCIKNYRPIIKELKINLEDKKFRKIRNLTGLIVIIFILIINFVKIEAFYYINPEIKYLLSIMLILLYLINYLFIFVKSVEKVSMIKEVEPEKLTEGDWIVEDVKVDNIYITGPKELGITKEQIQKLIQLKKQGKIDKIKVKYGIPFIPSFLLSLIYTYLTGRIIIFSI
ncbi:MAG: A24 family peptidase [Candidatus Woesearchaeota archaeon]